MQMILQYDIADFYIEWHNINLVYFSPKILFYPELFCSNQWKFLWEVQAWKVSMN